VLFRLLGVLDRGWGDVDRFGRGAGGRRDCERIVKEVLAGLLYELRLGPGEALA
jgi:hypothetical protein